jgi:hypothetical protein
LREVLRITTVRFSFMHYLIADGSNLAWLGKHGLKGEVAFCR